MRGKSMLLIVVAIGCGLVASIGISQVVTQPVAATGAGPATTEVYVASSEININDPLDAENVSLAVWPKEKVPEGAVTDLKQLEGKYARSWIYKDEVILEAKLTEIRGDNIVIPEGFRVMPLQVDNSKMSKLIKPGDRVDVMLYVGDRDGREAAVKTILSDVRIYSVNARVERERDGKNEDLARFVDVLVNAEQTEVLTLAAELGALSLTLRRPDDPTMTDTDGTAVSELLDLKEERGTEVREKSSDAVAGGSSAKSFRDWLNNMENSADSDGHESGTAADAGAGWTMVEMTPDGPVKYRLNGGDSPAVRLDDPNGGSSSDGDSAFDADDKPNPFDLLRGKDASSDEGGDEE